MRDRPSFTARWVASQRAHLERPDDVHGNADAERRLYEGLAGWLGIARLDRARMRRRTEWFDAATVDALASGVKQVVIVGAGYDGRALRFKGDGVRWIEVDHPATQADKRSRVDDLDVPTSHIAYAPVDLSHDDLDGALARAGHEPGEATLFIAEGLPGYLPRETIDRLFAVLRRRSTDDSILAANFRVLEHSRWIGDRVGRAVLDAILNVVGESRKSTFYEGVPERLLGDAGWTVIRHLVSDHDRFDATHGLFVLARPSAP
ncbi:MAG: class I SAM-dependent methyltransferase [Acidimicrobiia bacterium]|nr:class I SAM-dependent methyltransferase [Acidimicrobiia bacterium]